MTLTLRHLALCTAVAVAALAATQVVPDERAARATAIEDLIATARAGAPPA